MRYIILILLLLGLGRITSAQQYFNVRDPLHSFNSILTSVAEYNNKYYTTGICLDSSNYIGGGIGYIIWGIKFAVFDKNGNKLRDTFYQRQGIDIYSWDSKLIRQSDSSFLLATYAIDTSQYYLILYSFDTSGKMLMEKQYQKPICSTVSSAFWRLKDFKPDGNGNWLILSTIKCSSNHDLFLMKLDSSFNLLWYKQYGDGVLNDIAGKLLIEPDGYVLSGGRTNDNKVSKNFTYRAEIIKTDTAGNVQWTYLSPANRLTNQIQDIIKTQDGGYVYCGQGDGVEELAPNGAHADINWKGWVEKIDVNRNILWNKTISSLPTNIEANQQRVLKEMYDGSIVVGGMVRGGFEVWDTLHFNYGSLVKIDKNGNDIWKRKYSIPNDTFVYYIYDMKSTTDGGYILCGEARDAYYPYDAPTQRAWLVKVDSNGCMSATDPQCHPSGISEQTNSSSIVVYPNPANEALFIDYVNDQSLSFTLYDLMGRAVSRQKLHRGVNEVSLRHLPAGVYVYKLSTEKGIIQQGKVVKEL